MSADEVEQLRSTIDNHPFFLTIVQALIAGLTINTIAAWGEEVGWRGYLHEKLRPLGFWPSSLIIGLIWGVWHAPVILLGHNYPDHPVLGVPLMIAFCVAMSPIIQCLREKGGSVVTAALFHGSINACAGLSIMIVSGASDLVLGMTGIIGIWLLTILAILLYHSKAVAR